MDTPERNQIGTAISNFEDSPVFSYINSLSPLKPVKSTTVAQTINSLGSFSSPPPVFISPVGSRKQFRLLRRHCFPEPSNPELSGGNGNERNNGTGVLDAVLVSNSWADPVESFDPGGNIREVVTDPCDDNPEITIELPQELKYNCGSPDSYLIPSLGLMTDTLPDVAGTPTILDHHVQDISIESDPSYETKAELAGICQQDQTKGGSQVDSETCSFSFRTSNLPEDKIDNPQKRKVDDCVGSVQHEVERPFGQQVSMEKKGTSHSREAVSNTFYGEQGVNEPIGKTNEKGRSGIPFACNPGPQQQHGLRKRCLVFDMSRTHKITLEYGSNSSSITSKFDDKQLVAFKPVTGSSPDILPGIGLHLNALAATTKDCRVVKHETLASGRELISTRISIASSHCLTSEQKPINKTLSQNSIDKDMGLNGNEVVVVHNALQSTFGSCEEFNQSSLKKKRRQVKHVGQGEGCKGCSCKKSKCLKLYCECFAAGIYCMELCSCQECFNKPAREDTVLDTRKKIESRNPLAFAPKVIRSLESAAQTVDEPDRTPTFAQYKRGCNCKKSSCLKRYCECYQGGVGCSVRCHCQGCGNIFGQKDEWTGPEVAKQEAEETETLPNYVVQKSNEQYSDHILPQTPSFQSCRPSVRLPCSSSAKPQRSSECSSRSSAPPHTSRTIQSDFQLRVPKFKFHFQILPDNGTPEILSENSSHFTPTKTSSPNSKRVTPPHSSFGLSLGCRSSRKLVLQSIPSLPSLTPQHANSDFPVKFS